MPLQSNTSVMAGKIDIDRLILHPCNIKCGGVGEGGSCRLTFKLMPEECDTKIKLSDKVAEKSRV